MGAQAFAGRERGWQFVLLLLGGLAFATACAAAANAWGGWYGYWDANAAPSDRPYTIVVAEPRPGGASARGGLRDGDRIDLREQSLTARMGVAYQPVAHRPVELYVHRGSSTLHVRVVPSSVWEGVPAWKLPPTISTPLTDCWFAVCVVLIAMHRWWNRDARMLAIVLFCITLMNAWPGNFALPTGALGIALLIVTRTCMAIGAALLVRLSADFGTRSKLRTMLEGAAYAVVFLGFAADMAGALGMVTLWIDPIPYVFRIAPLRGVLDVVAWLFIVACALAAVARTPAIQRARTAWLLLPLPVALLSASAIDALLIVVKSWFANVMVIFVSDIAILLSAMIVTYALLKRRVLDFDFVLSRTVVVATLSAIVVISFVLLEWLLNTLLSGLSHSAGLVANAGLALVLGLSLNAIHKRVDAVVDSLLFRKRHEDERALLDFSKEAAYITESKALLDQAIANVKRHTDARSAAILLNGSGNTYAPVRSFGIEPVAVEENDNAILALKAWHKPVDPHHYATALRGALVFPMITRGRLLGVVELGERAGGEAYTPGETEALSQVAHGVGSALDALTTHDDAEGSTQHLLQLILQELRTFTREPRATDLRNSD